MGCGCCKDDVPPSPHADDPSRGPHRHQQSSRPIPAAAVERRQQERCDICSLFIDGSLYDGHRETCRANHRRSMATRQATAPVQPHHPAGSSAFSSAAGKCDDAGDDDDDSKCIICLDRPRTYALVPCGHVVGCYECVMKLPTCPVCRESRTGLLNVALESSKPKVCKHCRHRIGPTFFDGHAEVCAMRMRMKLDAAEAQRDDSTPLLNDDENASRACVECRKRSQETALIPCGHMLCSPCATAATSCPICLVDVKSTIKAYL